MEIACQQRLWLNTLLPGASRRSSLAGVDGCRLPCIPGQVLRTSELAEASYLAEVSVRVLAVIEHPVHLLTFQNTKATVASRPENLRNIKASEPVLAVFTVAPEVY
ncbi:hypothetical protein ABBQ32_002987 [Trebouxia sp. C0010 RCD-2024]